MALVAEQEREQISARTKAALQAAKARGQRLGSPKGADHLLACGAYTAGLSASQASRTARADTAAETLRPFLEQVMTELPGGSLRQIAERMNAAHLKTPRGGSWSAAQVKRLKARLGIAA